MKGWRKSSPSGGATPAGRRPRKGRLRRGIGFLGRAIGLVFLFGAAVSVASFVRTPGIRVEAAPEPGVRVDEITRLYPITMARISTPKTVEDIAAALRGATGKVSIGGGRNSMGGQTATPGGTQIDLRDYRGVVAFDPVAKTITVRSGTRWRDVQEAIDPAGLAVKIMQTYNTFTVGGALSVNCHGRYIGQGPMIQSVRGLTLVLPDGRVVSATPKENSELFYAAVGGYGAVGVVADVSLDLAANSRVRREDEKMPVAAYASYFRSKIRDAPGVVFHNADIYPPAYEDIHAVSYRQTDAPVTVEDRIRPADQASWVHRLAYDVITGWPKGPWIREHVMDPFLFLGNPVTWRNYEASYDISELEPASRQKTTYVLQEYFVPIEAFDDFTERMRKILRTHEVDAVNVSVRHALPDPGSLLAWAPNEVFAFVLYYRQATDPAARYEVGRWTRELIDAVLACGGRYYLPYQPVATRRQFASAYPRSAELFALKRRVDPTDKLTNTLWDLYAPDATGSFPPATPQRLAAALPAEARIVLDEVKDYTREEAAELMTHPEWDLVYSSEAYARWLEQGRKPSGFPYIACVGTFWRSYYGTWRAAHERYPIGIGSHVLLNVIGMSTAMEYGLKEVYENTFGRLSELAMPPGGTDEDRYAARIAREYVGLIERVGWYEFDFGKALRELWTTVPASGPGFLRKWERRFFLSGEYGIKATYAWLIGLGTRMSYTPDVIPRGIVAVGWDEISPAIPNLAPSARLDRGYTLLTVPRYNPFRDALLALSERSGSVRLAEVCGSERVTLTGTAPRGWIAPAGATSVVAYAVPVDTSRNRILLEVGARDLLEVIHRLRTEGQFRIDHVYDY